MSNRIYIEKCLLALYLLFIYYRLSSYYYFYYFCRNNYNVYTDFNMGIEMFFLRIEPRLTKVVSSYIFAFVFIFVLSNNSYSSELKELNLGILSLSPPSKIYKNWKPFAQYLSSKLDMKVNIIAPRGFGKLKKMAENKQVDLFYVNSHIFYRLKKSGKAVPIAQMYNIADSTTSQSNIFVRNDSHISDISQLKGKTFAFVSPMGAGGYLAPRAFMYEHGIKTKQQTNEIFTKNLTNSIYDVLLGKADAATMCGVNYQLMSKKLDTGELKIIASSSKYPENVLAARSNLPTSLLDKIRTIVISMPDDSHGKEVLTTLNKMKIKKFIPYDPEIEKLTEKLLRSGEFSG